MLMRTDPFRDLDRLSQAVFGTPARPAMMPMDAYRDQRLVRGPARPPRRGPRLDRPHRRAQRAHGARRAHPPRPRRPSGSPPRSATGLFSRQLFLGDSLDVDRLSADYTDGVLTLRIPVAERAKPRRIEIQHTDRSQRPRGHGLQPADRSSCGGSPPTPRAGTRRTHASALGRPRPRDPRSRPCPPKPCRGARRRRVVTPHDDRRRGTAHMLADTQPPLRLVDAERGGARRPAVRRRRAARRRHQPSWTTGSRRPRRPSSP